MKKTFNLSILSLVLAVAAFGQATTTSTTLSATVAANTTTQWCVASATGISLASMGGSASYLMVDREVAQITSQGTSSTCYNVRRGQLGTSANASHRSGTTVYVGNAATGSGDTSRPFSGVFTAVAPSGYCVASQQYSLPVLFTGSPNSGFPAGRRFNCINNEWTDVTPEPQLTVTGNAPVAAASATAAAAALTVTGGTGGAQSATTSGGAAGGANTITGGVGGAGGSSSGTGGTGGATTIKGGAGGGTVTGGTGGAATVQAGAGGAGSTAGGSGGAVVLQAGAAGAGGTGVAGTVQIKDAADPTKIVSIVASGLTTATTRTLTVPDASITISGAQGIECGTAAGACTATAIGSTLKIVRGTATSTSASPSTVAITGISPAFTSAATYSCTASNATTVANVFSVLTAGYVSGSAVTFTGPNTLTDVIRYTCIGY